MKLEICIDSIDSLVSAAYAGCDRVEICSALSLDGLTPHMGLVDEALTYKNIEKYVMIRPREGHFTYDNMEFYQMKRDILSFKDKAIDGFVFGVLDEYGRIDIERMKELVYLAFPKRVVLHRAFDYSVDGEEKVEQLIDMEIERILTSGKKPKAMEGLDLIANLQKKYGDRIEIMAGSGVNPDNIKEIYTKTKIENFHMSARVDYQTTVEYDKFGKSFKDYHYSSSGIIKQARLAIDSLKIN